MNTAPKLMSQTEYAAYRKVGKSAVSNWKAAGLVVFSEDERGGLKVDVARTDARVNAKIDPTRGRPTKGGRTGELFDPAEAAPPAQVAASVSPKLAEVRTDLMASQLVGQNLKNLRAAGELVALAEFQRRAAEGFRLARERMMSIVRTNAERLAAEKDPRTITALFNGEIDRAFAELADQITSGALNEVDDEAALEALDVAEDAAPDLLAAEG